MILEGEILEECRTTEVNILEEDIEVASGMIILEEVEVGLEKDSILVTLGGMIEAVVDQDQVVEQVPIEIELDASNVGSMIILLNIVLIYQKPEKKTGQIQQILNFEKDKMA